MKKLIMLAVIVFMCSFQTKKAVKIVFFGDSITEYGVRPDGYITLFQQKLKDNNQAANYEVAGAGIGGNKIYDLYLRYEDDVLSKNPDVVVIWVGVNDVWHKRLFGTGTDWDKFSKFYTALIKKLQAKGIKVTICTPASVGEKIDYSNELDGDLNKYSQIIRELAAQNNCGLVDFRKLFHEYGLKNNPQNQDKNILTVDGVHLNAAGNKLVADALYQSLIK
ncbi:GDSL-type esterase/lipase family protein [Mucilaginibacter sp.]|uniref:SGNH/GDSL hydrolase family protein n=1 Tax=Mucilaginibacter sp. TaxID=1882438 RepID=UPI00262252F1|nr:GDSL-type esterase/lipase family protein [Mucilaginibacter sp.]